MHTYHIYIYVTQDQAQNIIMY